MAKPIINIADVELEPRPSAFAPTGPPQSALMRGWVLSARVDGP